MNRADTHTVLDRISEYDHREVTADTIADWHREIGHLDLAVALEAVAIHHKTSTWSITPAAVLALVQQRAGRPDTAPRPKRRAVRGAYMVAGAISVGCPTCGAEPNETCTSASGHEAFLPCVARLTGGAAA